MRLPYWPDSHTDRVNTRNSPGPATPVLGKLSRLFWLLKAGDSLPGVYPHALPRSSQSRGETHSGTLVSSKPLEKSQDVAEQAAASPFVVVVVGGIVVSERNGNNIS